MTNRSDERFKALLPSEDGPYNFDGLSEAEIAALEAALSDGFGDAGSTENDLVTLPDEIESGLLRHSVLMKNSAKDEYEDEEMWEESRGEPNDDDTPNIFDQFPLHFDPDRLKLFFENQMSRFCAGLIAEEADYASADRWQLQNLARFRLYKKPWYEYHALQLFSQIAFVEKEIGEQKSVTTMLRHLSILSGKVGRLVEQYYWRFHFEGPAKIGIKTTKGASLGGKTKSSTAQTEHLAWQNAASEIWARRSDLSTAAVAELIKRQLDDPRTAKHIARYIKRP